MLGNFFFSSTGEAAYEIEQSLRFERTDSAHLGRTFGTPTTQNVYTYSTWLKYIGYGENTFTRSNYKDTWLLSPYQDNNDWGVLQVNNSLKFVNYTSDNESRGTDGGIVSDMVVRDPSAWYHVIFVLDATQSALSDRMEIYVNGVKQSVSSTGNPVGQNQTTVLNKASTVHYIGRNERIGQLDSNARYFSMMLAETHFVDGQALDATDFGEFDNNGVWRPIRYTGTYGNNGFYLKYDETATNGIGHDHSGNGNNFTASGFTTSGTGTDVMSDTPTTNWCTWNPLDKDTDVSVSDGNLTASQSSGGIVRGTVGVTSGKWYWETTVNSGTAMIGIANEDSGVTGTWVGINSNGYAYYGGNGNKYNNGATSYGSSYGSGDVIGTALDLDAGSLVFYKNGVSQGTAFTGLSGVFFPAVGNDESPNVTANFGQRDFAYTPPTDFLPLNTSNLPSPDIADGSEYFSTTLYTGVSGSQSVDAGMATDLAWIKSRSTSQSHSLTDRVRGNDLVLQSNETSAETSGDIDLTSTGVTIGNNNALRGAAGVSYVLWSWLAGGSGSSNTVGSITSTVSANTTAGFSIITYSGNSTNNSTIGHGLGVAPSMIITKVRTGASNEGWPVWHTSLGGNTKYLQLNQDSSVNTDSNIYGGSNNTAPTSTVYSVGSGGVTNTSGRTYVAYCFAEVEGYSKFGSYDGNGNANGPFVYCGFRPAWIMTKNWESTGSWLIRDTARETYNPTYAMIPADNNNSEATSTGYYEIDILSNGFKVRVNNTSVNRSNSGFIFMAFAENPFGGSDVSPATAR